MRKNLSKEISESMGNRQGRRGMNIFYLSVSAEGEGPPGSCPERFHSWEGGRSGEGAGLASSPEEGRSP